MTAPTLPHLLPLRRFTPVPEHWVGRFSLADFERFLSCRAEEETQGVSDLELDLILKRDAGGRAVLSGQFSTTLLLVCQRCLRPVTLSVMGELNWMLAEKGVEIPDHFDAIECPKGQVDFKTALEDELILALPAVPLHPDSRVCESFNPTLLKITELG